MEGIGTADSDNIGGLLEYRRSHRSTQLAVGSAYLRIAQMILVLVEFHVPLVDW